MKKGVEKWRLTWCMSFAKVAGFRTPGLHVFVPSLTVVVKRSKVCALFESVLAVIWNTRPVQSLICSLIQSLPCSFVHSFIHSFIHSLSLTHSFIHSFTKLAVLFTCSFLTCLFIYLCLMLTQSSLLKSPPTFLCFLSFFLLFFVFIRSTSGARIHL